MCMYSIPEAVKVITSSEQYTMGNACHISVDWELDTLWYIFLGIPGPPNAVHKIQKRATWFLNELRIHVLTI